MTGDALTPGLASALLLSLGIAMIRCRRSLVASWLSRHRYLHSRYGWPALLVAPPWEGSERFARMAVWACAVVAILTAIAFAAVAVDEALRYGRGQ